MEMVTREFRFRSHERTYIKDITPDVNGAIAETNTNAGRLLIVSKHTTLGLIVTELDEPNFVRDLIRHSLEAIPEDVRSSWVVDQTYPYTTTDRYKHYCMDSPLRDPDEIDDDYNAARHLRALIFSRSSIDLPYLNGQLVLGRFQRLGYWEFDGRDGSGKNPERIRRIFLAIYPAEKVTALSDVILEPQLLR